jgi:hypothetical protein
LTDRFGATLRLTPRLRAGEMTRQLVEHGCTDPSLGDQQITLAQTHQQNAAGF